LYSLAWELGEIGIDKVDIRARFRAIRGNRTLDEMSQFIKTKEQTRQAWYKLETGKTKSLSFEQLKKLFHEGKVDPLFLCELDMPPGNINPVHDCIRKHTGLLELLKRLCDLDDEDVSATIDLLRVFVSDREKKKPGGRAAG
jgi:hypothetical protein